MLIHFNLVCQGILNYFWVKAGLKTRAVPMIKIKCMCLYGFFILRFLPETQIFRIRKLLYNRLAGRNCPVNLLWKKILRSRSPERENILVWHKVGFIQNYISDILISTVFGEVLDSLSE